MGLINLDLLTAGKGLWTGGMYWDATKEMKRRQVFFIADR
jgi:hypothetical protein